MAQSAGACLQEGAIPATSREVLNGFDLVDALVVVLELGPTREVLTAGFSRPLHAHGELAGANGSLVCPREVADKGFLEVDPCVDAANWQTIQPRASRPLEHERCVAHGETTIGTGDANGRGVVGEPVFWLHGPATPPSTTGP